MTIGFTSLTAFTLIFVQTTSVSTVLFGRTQTFIYQLSLNLFIMDPGLEGIQKAKLFNTGYTQKNGAVSSLTRNLFLTLHGDNVHRPKFLIRYQQFASYAYCGAAEPVSKMASQQEKAFCVLRFDVSRSVITVQREFRAQFRKDAPCVVRLF